MVVDWFVEMNRGELKRKIKSAVEEIVNDAGVITYHCVANIDAEIRCYYVQTTFNPANFKRHLVAHHQEVAARLEFNKKNATEQITRKRSKPSKVTVEITRQQVLLGTLQLITNHNLPLKYPEWKAMRLLIGPLWKSLNLTVTRNTMPVFISNAADKMRIILSDVFRKKAVCLKVDSATRHAKSVFGINLSLVDDAGNIQIFHLGKFSYYISINEIRCQRL